MTETWGRSHSCVPGRAAIFAAVLSVCETRGTAHTISRGYATHGYEFLGSHTARDVRLRGIPASPRPGAHIRAHGALHGSGYPQGKRAVQGAGCVGLGLRHRTPEPDAGAGQPGRLLRPGLRGCA